MASLQPQQEGWSALPLELDEPERIYTQQDSDAPKPAWTVPEMVIWT